MLRTLHLDCAGDIPNPFYADEAFGVAADGKAGGNVLQADIAVDRLPVEDASFDYVTAYDSLAKVPRLVYAPGRRNAFVELINEVYRVLRPGGIFVCQTPAYPHAKALENPAYVNLITDKTFPAYFDDVHRKAADAGFKGAFHVRLQEWRDGSDLYVALRKVPLDHNAIWPVPTVRKISIVVPVFNGEQYLAQTLNSMLAQSCSDFEIIGVDDCSTDGSYRVLQEFAARDSRVRPLRTSVNMGSAPKVLNFALTHMTGGYFVYASQDDLFSKDWLEKMLARSLETGADAVIPDVTYYYEQEPQRNRHMVGVNGDRQAQLTGREAVVASLGWTIPGNALWNAELIKKMGFAEFAINSDEYSVRRFFNVANKVVFCDGEFLYRQDNANAITKKKSIRYFDFSYTHLKLAHWLFEQGYPKEAVLKELKSARKGMAAMVQWYAEIKQDLSEAELQEVDKRMARFTKTLSDLHPLGKLPRRYF